MDLQSVFHIFGGGQGSVTSNNTAGSTYNQAAYNEAHPSVATSISRVPGQIAGMLGHGAVALGNSLISGPVDLVRHVSGADLNSTIQKQQSLYKAGDEITASFKAGKINKDQYKAALAQNIQDLTSVSKEAHDYSKNYRKNLAIDELKTAGTVATLASGGLAAAGKTAAEAAVEGGGVAAARAALNGNKVAETVGKFADGLVGTGKTMGNNVISVAGGKIVRNALVTQPTIDQTVKLGTDVSHGDLKQSAIDAGILIGAPLAITKGAPIVGKAATAASLKLFGKSSFLDSIPTSTGEKITDFLKSDKATAADQKTARIMQQYNLNQSQGSVSRAVNFYKSWLGEDAAAMSPQQHLQDFQKMVDEVNDYRAMALKGDLPKPGGGEWTKDEIKNIWVGRFSTADRTAINNELDGLSHAERVDKIGQLAETEQWGQNDHLVNQLKDAAAEDNYKAQIAKLNPTVDLRGNLVGAKDTFAVVDGASDGAAKFDEAVGTKPSAESVKETVQAPTQGDNKYVPIIRTRGTDIPSLRKSGEVVAGQAPSKTGQKILDAGLSPRDEGPVTDQVKASMATQLSKSESPYLKGQGNAVYKALTRKVDQMNGVYDPRMLTKGQILDALGSKASPEDAGEVQKAIRQAFTEVSARQAGLGGKMLNKVLNDVPLMNQYLKVQGIAKFSANPFFYMKRLTKSGILAMLHGTDHFGMSGQTEQTLRQAGYFSKYIQDMGTADFFGSNIGQAGKNQLSGPIKNIVGGMAESMAKAKGMTVAEMLDDPELGPELDHAIRTTLGYPKGGYINSPLAKTLNILIFPSRFETKVGMAVAHAMAEQPPAVQAAIVTDVAHLSSYLGSPEGKQWQKDNAETLNLVKYFTPVATIGEVAHALGGDVHLGDLGEIGGLPFGVLSIILQHQGADLGPVGSSPYRDPKTDEIVPESIPDSLKGRTQQAVTDLIESTFSWPGRQAGLSLSKGDLVQSLPGLKKNPADFKTVTPGDPTEASVPTETTGKIPKTVETTPQATPTFNVPATYTASQQKRAKAPKVVPASLQIKP